MTPDGDQKPPPVVALAGRRVDAADAKEARFSPGDVEVVRERVRRALAAVKPAALVCSAACGADLLALDEAADLGIPRRIVLPFAKERFRETSVVDRPGNWGKLFDRIVAEAEAANSLVVADVAEGDEGYREANRAILKEAQREAPLGGVEAWIVWNGRPRDDSDVTLHFADEALKRELFVRVVSTLPAGTAPSAPENTKTCFVVMPFGVKPVDGKPVPFDAIFDAILAPAIGAVALPEGGTLVPYRTDRDVAPDLIDQAMFERLEYSRFVFCDLTGLNPNVMFELGMRFHARSSGTVLFRQPGTPLPFDITGVKVFEYDTREPTTARRMIPQVLTEALKRNRLDSPIRRALDQRSEPTAPQTDGLLRQAEAALASGDAATARAMYAQAATLSPRDAVVRLRLATLEKQRQKRDWATILAEAQAATELAPDYAEAWRERGIAEGQLWRSAADKAAVPDGVESLRRAIQLNPQDFDAHASFGGILRRQDKLNEALEQYRAAVDVSEGHPYPLLNVIKLEADVLGKVDLARYQRKLASAARIREPQTKAAPPADVPWSFFDLAEIRLYQGSPDEAIAALRGGSDLYGKDQLSDFRGLLDRLRKTGADIPGLDRLIAAADGLLATATHDGNVADAVEEIFQRMPGSLAPEAARGVDGVIQFNLTGEGGGTYHVAIKDGSYTVKKGAHEAPHMTMTMPARDYVDMISGKLDGQSAFRSGKLKISGDVGLALKMENLFPRPAEGGPTEAVPPAPQEPAPAEKDEVYLAVSAAPNVVRGQRFASRFAAYVKALEEKVAQTLTELDPGRTRVETGLTSNTRWQRGAPVTVRLSGDHMTAAPPEQSFEWSGTENLLGFLVTVAAGAPLGDAYLVFDVSIAGVTVALIPFVLSVTEAPAPATERRLVQTPAHTAFASYSAADKVRVLDRLGAVCAYDKSLEVFTDCLDLKPGDKWQHELETVIPARELFLLFWSENAMKSQWVDWEWRRALAAKGLLAIQPIPLDPPQLAPPPEELKSLHFADKYVLAREGALRIEERRAGKAAAET